jgi:hypothetical protein
MPNVELSLSVGSAQAELGCLRSALVLLIHTRLSRTTQSLANLEITLARDRFNMIKRIVSGSSSSICSSVGLAESGAVLHK